MDPNQWTRVQKRNEKQRKNLSLFVNLYLSLSLSLCLDSFCLPIAMRSSFVCLLFKHLVFFILVVKGQETRFPKRLSLDETMKQGWSLRWNVAVAIMRKLPCHLPRLSESSWQQVSSAYLEDHSTWHHTKSSSIKHWIPKRQGFSPGFVLMHLCSEIQ